MPTFGHACLRSRRRDSLADLPARDSLEIYVRREDAERFIEDVRGDESTLMRDLRIDECRRSKVALRPLNES